MQIDAGHLGQIDETADSGERDHVEIIRHLLARFGKFAEGLFDYHDFGFPREMVRRHIANAESEIRRFQALASDTFLAVPAAASDAEVREVWNAKKNLRYAAGAVMISSGFRSRTSPENRLRALRLKVLYEAFVDSIDDLIDTEQYSFSDALDLMRHCLNSLTSPRFDRQMFRDELAGRLSPAQRGMADFFACLGEAIQESIRESPQGALFVGELSRLHENWALGEAYTMYQRDPTLDVHAFLIGASHLPAPDADLHPWEVISGWISHTTALSILDLCYANTPMPATELEEHLVAWYYFDIIMTLMDHLIDAQQDVEAGIANVFMIGYGGPEVGGLREARGFRFAPTMRDYEACLARCAELARRALEHARRSREDPEFFFPFLLIMEGIVMFVTEAGIREDVLHAYLRILAPIIRNALAAEPPPVPTIPLGTRNGRIRSARTASS